MNIIVAVYNDWGIGKDGSQQIIIPDDRRFFKKLTTGKTIIVGRKTYEDIGKPLPARQNFILTRNKDFNVNNAITINSTSDLLKTITNYEEIFVIGGESVYNLLIPYCDHAYVTKIDANPPSDTFFPNLDKSPDWSLQKVLHSDVFVDKTINNSTPLKYSIMLYRRTLQTT